MKKVNFLFIAAALFLCSNQAFAQPQNHPSNTNNSGSWATALGSGTAATGDYSTALGLNTIASGDQAFASGQNSEASEVNSVAIGGKNEASGTGAMAFGSSVTASNANSIVIGAGPAGSSLENSKKNSLMVGFDSEEPTFYVGSSDGGVTTGKVGIGTSDPTAILHLTSTSKNPNFKLSSQFGQNVELGIADSEEAYSGFASAGDAVYRVSGAGTNTNMIFSIPSSVPDRRIVFANSTNKIMTIKAAGTGKVGIGTENFPTTLGGSDLTDYQLFVAGGILTEEVRVRTDWADYVFQSDYDLKPLSEVSEFINTNGHLPNVPSASTVKEEGIEIGEITKIQQEKIEELTLYLIDLQKQIDALRSDKE